MSRTDLSSKDQITGLVLAGGQGSRLGGQDKGLIELNGRPMIEHVLSRLSPQVGKVFINANRNMESYGGYGCEVISDSHTGFQGPLAGMASGLQHSTSKYLLCVPCDSPLLLANLADRLLEACSQQTARIAIPHDGNRTHPVFALIDCSLRGSLGDYLAGGDRKIDRWMSQHQMITVDFSDAPECFSNVNTEDDLERARRTLEKFEQDARSAS
ncbi:MAG: molybdenum cofactor guanylyltransferase MobA [Gammaproteobacteria bacterium]